MVYFQYDSEAERRSVEWKSTIFAKTEKIAFLKIRNQAEVYFSYNGIDIIACGSNSG